MRNLQPRRRSAGSWQWQPTLTAHDPSNVLTIDSVSEIPLRRMPRMTGIYYR